MIIELTDLPEDYFVRTRKFKVGQRFRVQGEPTVSENNGVKRMGYMVYSDHGNALMLYDDEIRVLN